MTPLQEKSCAKTRRVAWPTAHPTSPAGVQPTQSIRMHNVLSIIFHALLQSEPSLGEEYNNYDCIH